MRSQVRSALQHVGHAQLRRPFHPGAVHHAVELKGQTFLCRARLLEKLEATDVALGRADVDDLGFVIHIGRLAPAHGMKQGLRPAEASVERSHELRKPDVERRRNAIPVQKRPARPAMLVVDDTPATHPGALGKFLVRHLSFGASCAEGCGQLGHVRLSGQRRKRHLSMTVGRGLRYSATSCIFEERGKGL